jgi:hypothetical protein
MEVNKDIIVSRLVTAALCAWSDLNPTIGISFATFNRDFRQYFEQNPALVDFVQSYKPDNSNTNKLATSSKTYHLVIVNSTDSSSTELRYILIQAETIAPHEEQFLAKLHQNSTNFNLDGLDEALSLEIQANHNHPLVMAILRGNVSLEPPAKKIATTNHEAWATTCLQCSDESSDKVNVLLKDGLIKNLTIFSFVE